MEKQNSKYRWVVFGTVLFTYFLIVSQRTAPGLITDQLMKDFGLTASTIGLLTSIQFLAYASLQIPIGLLSNGYIKTNEGEEIIIESLVGWAEDHRASW